MTAQIATALGPALDEPGALQQPSTVHVRYGSKADIGVECAPDGGHLAGIELTKAAGLSEDESHGQTTFP